MSDDIKKLIEKHMVVVKQDSKENPVSPHADNLLNELMGMLSKARLEVQPEPTTISPGPWKVHPKIDEIIIDGKGTMIIECLGIDHLGERLPARLNAKHIVDCLNKITGMERELIILRSQMDTLRKRVKMQKGKRVEA